MNHEGVTKRWQEVPKLTAEQARSRHAEAHNELNALLDNAKATVKIAAKERRDMTEAEKVEVERSQKAAEELRWELTRLQTHIADQGFYKSIRELTGDTMQTYDPRTNTHSPYIPPGSLDTIVGAKAVDHRWGQAACKQVEQVGGQMKALTGTGTIAVPTAFDGAPVRQGETPTLLRQLAPTKRLQGTDRFAWMVQTVRENNAAPVPRGARKPTSRFTVERREDRCRVIATLTEPIHRNDLVDSIDLARFVDSELRFAVLEAEEQQLVTGDGQGESLTGILSTPGTTVQPYVTDLFTTLRRALTVQQRLGNTPTGWMISPEDWESITLTRENGATGAFVLESGPVDVAQQRLWSLPVAVSTAVPQGTAVLGDFAGSMVIYEREQVVVTYSESLWLPDALGAGQGANTYATNQLVFRAESRIGLAIGRPSAFTEVDLTPGA